MKNEISVARRKATWERVRERIKEEGETIKHSYAENTDVVHFKKDTVQLSIFSSGTQV